MDIRGYKTLNCKALRLDNLDVGGTLIEKSRVLLSNFEMDIGLRCVGDGTVLDPESA